MYSFYDLLGKYSGNNENDVLEFYASVIRIKIKELFPGNPKDKTTIINGTIFVSKDDKAVLDTLQFFTKSLNDSMILVRLKTLITILKASSLKRS